MSADDDTFDIDIYGDDADDNAGTTEPAQPQQHAPAQQTVDEDEIDYDYQDPNDDDRSVIAGREVKLEVKTEQSEDEVLKKEDSTPQPNLKRKANEMSIDEKPLVTGIKTQHTTGEDTKQPVITQQTLSQSLDPNAVPALKLTDMPFYTSEETLRAITACTDPKAESQITEVCFGEHKVNGKSRGEVFIAFETPQAASLVKNKIEDLREPSVAASHGLPKTQGWVCVYWTGSNPFLSFGKEGGAQSNRGAYNAAPQRGARGGRGARGEFGGRGRGYDNGMGRGAPMLLQQQQQGGWGMNGMNGGMTMPGMMTGFNQMGNMMGNMGNMMNNMMGNGGMGGMNSRGGYGGGMGMGNMMNGMGNMGAMGMNGGARGGRGGWQRGGWSGPPGGYQDYRNNVGMQGGGSSLGYNNGSMSPQGGGQGQQGNKRARQG